MSITFAGASQNGAVSLFGRSPGVANYFLGFDAKSFVMGVRHYRRASYHDVWPGVDVHYYGTPDGALEFDFQIHPSADVRPIELRVQDADGLMLDESGAVRIRLADSELVLRAPQAYQIRGGQRTAVAVRYVLFGGNRISLALGKYDELETLWVDPVLGWATYAGGSSEEEIYSIAHDGNGAVYIAGVTNSTDFPAFFPLQGSLTGGTDAFVAKFAESGTPIYITYIGGANDDVATCVEVLADGTVFVAGHTDSADFPTTPLALQNAHSGGRDVFVLSLTPSGDALAYSTFLGGGATEECYALAVDPAGQAHVAGWTNSIDFPLANAWQLSKAHGADTFVSKLAQTGSSLRYSSYHGGGSGTYGERAFALALDDQGYAYVGGFTDSPYSRFPTTEGVYQRTYRWMGDGYLLKIAPDGGAEGLVFSTLLGGGSPAGFECISGIVVDDAGCIYVTGRTHSGWFPGYPHAWQSQGPADQFFLKFNQAASQILYSKSVGGSSTEHLVGANIGSLAMDTAGDVYLVAITTSIDVATVDPIQDFNAGAYDAMIGKFDPLAEEFSFLTYYGGSGDDIARDIIVTAPDRIWVVGSTSSPDLPGRCCFQANHGNGVSDGFLIHVSPSAALAVMIAGDGDGMVTSDPDGIDCGAICSADFPLGAVVTLTAVPGPGSSFTGWSGDVSGSDPVLLVALSSDISVTATFVPNLPPVADAGPDHEIVLQAMLVLDGSGSSDPDGTITNCNWSLGDETTAAGMIVQHRYSSVGIYTVILTVTDDWGATGSDSATVVVIDQEQAASDLIEVVEDLDLPGERQNALTGGKLDKALEALADGDIEKAIDRILNFIDFVERKIDNWFDQATADGLLEPARELLESLQQSLGSASTLGETTWSTRALPNPAGPDPIRFETEYENAASICVEVYSLAGKLVYTSGTVLGRTVEWDLRDTEEVTVANGPYAYVIIVLGPSGEVLEVNKGVVVVSR